MLRYFVWVVMVAVTATASAEPQPPWEIGRTEPAWSAVKPERTIQLMHDPGKSDQRNGEQLAKVVAELRPGDRLEIGAGRYLVERKFNLDLRGTSNAPIWIVGADADQLPIITRSDARQNVINVGEHSRTEYVCMRHLELTGGSTLIRFHDCHHLWLDHCHLHHSGAEGITTNTRDSSHLFITGNHFHHFTQPGATGEAMYLGGNHGKVAMSYSVIADNHVHDCGGKQGDGIEVKQGSHHNWIFRNHVHDTNYPCILVYGTGGRGWNVIERNLCYRSDDSVLQVQGEAIVRNNLMISGAGSGFSSTDHQGRSKQLIVVQNTIVSRRRGANLSSWNDREGMVFANNAVYTDQGDALRFPNGARGAIVSGNVIVGSVSGVRGGYSRGIGLRDFADLSWDAKRRNAEPAVNSALIGAADPDYRSDRDIRGRERGRGRTAGAYAVP